MMRWGNSPAYSATSFRVMSCSRMMEPFYYPAGSREGLFISLSNAELLCAMKDDLSDGVAGTVERALISGLVGSRAALPWPEAARLRKVGRIEAEWAGVHADCAGAESGRPRGTSRVG